MERAQMTARQPRLGVIPTNFRSTARTNRRFAEIEEEWKPIIRWKARAVRIPWLDSKDLMQYGQLALLYAIAKADPKRDTFARFANEILDRTFATLVRDALREKRTPVARAVCGDSVFEEVNDDLIAGAGVSPESAVIAEDLRTQLLAGLPEFDRRVAVLRIRPTRELRAAARARAGDGVPITEDDIATVLGCRRSRVKHSLTRIRAALSALLAEGDAA